jgi:nucleoside-diphosphate kinase
MSHLTTSSLVMALPRLVIALPCLLEPDCSIVSPAHSLTLFRSIKSLTPSPALAKEHYSDLASRPFYGGLVKYITSGTPVVAM